MGGSLFPIPRLIIMSTFDFWPLWSSLSSSSAFAPVTLISIPCCPFHFPLTLLPRTFTLRTNPSRKPTGISNPFSFRCQMGEFFLVRFCPFTPPPIVGAGPFASFSTACANTFLLFSPNRFSFVHLLGCFPARFSPQLTFEDLLLFPFRPCLRSQVATTSS